MNMKCKNYRADDVNCDECPVDIVPDCDRFAAAAAVPTTNPAPVSSSLVVPAPAVDDARVERAARVDYEFSHKSAWASAYASTKAAFRRKARAVLSAANSAPVPAVDWQSEPPGEPGFWFWRFVGDTEAHVIELDAGDDYPFDCEGHPREYWPVPIEPPARGGTK